MEFGVGVGFDIVKTLWEFENGFQNNRVILESCLYKKRKKITKKSNSNWKAQISSCQIEKKISCLRKKKYS